MINNFSLTVIIPSFNRRIEISETIESIIEIKSIEQIIIVDDCSDIDYRTIPELKNGKTRIIRNTQNMGESCSVNIAMKEVMTDYVMILSDDDPQSKQLFDSLETHVRQKPNFGVYVPSYTQGPQPSIIERIVIAESVASKDVLDLLICPAGPGAILNLRKIKDRNIRDSDARIPSDLIQWLNLALVTDFYAAKDAFAFWRSSKFQGSNKLYSYEGLNEYSNNLSKWIRRTNNIQRERMYISLVLRIIQLSKNTKNLDNLSNRIIVGVVKQILTDSRIKPLKFFIAMSHVVVEIFKRKIKRNQVLRRYRKQALNA